MEKKAIGITVERDEDGAILKLMINGELLKSKFGEENETYVVPKGLLKNIAFRDMPEGVTFEVCDRIDAKGVIHLSTLPFEISKISDNKAQILFEDMGSRKFWDGDIGYKLYMETKRDIIKNRQKEIGDVRLEHYKDDGDYIILTFSAQIESQTFEGMMVSAEQLIKEIEGTAELTIGSPFKNLEDIRVEEDFSLLIVIPVLRKLGFSNIRYSHGKREFGKDIVFSRKTEFDYFEFWGAQVKCGNISGKANSEIDEIIAQIDDAFKVPFYDLYTKQREKISKLLIVISGSYTENAIEKICEKIENNALKNNVVFIDGEKLSALISRFNEETKKEGVQVNSTFSSAKPKHHSRAVK
ncbi:MAG TPA: hypothetical protein VK487_09575 [Candidatus Bathyarchaeia archaeon]|nr:hypothetical protein [Candidatus Bathyarchaeia archaeon]